MVNPFAGMFCTGLMNKRFLIPVILVMSLNAFAQDSKIGIGVILGYPTGFTAKLWTGEKTAIDATLGYHFGNISSLYLSADFLIHQWAFDVDQGIIKIFFGPGAGLGFSSDLSISARAPGGVSYCFDTIPLEAFADIIPTLQVIGPGGVRFWVGGYIGARWYL